jgi:hypothetical protein
MATRLHGALKEASNEGDTSENKPKARFCRLTADCRKRLEPEAGEFQRLVQAIQLAMKPA